MCGRFVQYSDPEIYASEFALDAVCESTARYNVAPTQPVLAIRETAERKRELIPLRWGLVPAWSKGPDNRYSMINARAETVSTKPAYRSAFKRRRCLIPAEGFYEWKAERRQDADADPARNSAPFAMAGLWEHWQDATGASIESCTIIVTDANALVRPVHERMPVILDPADYAAWLDPANANTDALLQLLQPADPDHWTLHPVSRRVNSPKNEGPDLLLPRL
jgi:putative SOS response-associated peptidase YedK